MRASEPGVSARVGGAAEADLVPGPRVSVEGLERIAHDDAPGAGDVEPVPRAAVEPRLRERVADLELVLETEVGERGRAPPPRLLVEALRHELPGLAVGRHVEVLVAVERSLVELLVDVIQDRDPGLGVLREHDVREGPERDRLLGREEADRRHVVDAVEDDPPRDLVPVRRLLEHVVVWVPAVHLWRRPAPLARQVGRIGVRLLAPALGPAEVSVAAHYFSRPTRPARTPRPPTRQSEPGARSGGPITRLYVGSAKPPGRLRTPWTWVTMPTRPSSA